MKKLLSTASALVLIFSFVGPALAAPRDAPPNSDPYGYYSEMDQQGYYDRGGHYVRYADNTAQYDDQDYGPAPRVYNSSDYEANCRKGNTAAGTVFGAIAGGLLGGALSSGRHHGADPAAVVGGIILGGMAGNAMTRDIPCEDHSRAFSTYADGLNGRIGEEYAWRNEHTGDYGYFTPNREFRRGTRVCRSFKETTWIRGKRFERSGTACRATRGNWQFD